MLCNRLSPALESLISVNQSAFIKGRQILDSILITNEVATEMQNKHTRGFMFKVDFEKAYDYVSWDYLQYIMELMGLCDTWRRWIQGCLFSSTISILVNGSPTDEFTPKRGLRQGDPLSPFPFLLAAEGLSKLFDRTTTLRAFKGIRIGGQEIEVTHLQFADDMLIIGESTWCNIWATKAIFNCSN